MTQGAVGDQTPDATKDSPAGCLIGCGGLLLIAIALVGGALFVSNQRNSVDDAMLSFCVNQVASWAAVPSSQVTGYELSTGPNSGGIDFKGTYPGGVWACGGISGESVPSSVVVVPAGGMPDGAYSGEIYSSR